jgi:hypothetical protein
MDDEKFKALEKLSKELHERDDKNRASVEAIQKLIDACKLDTIDVPKVVAEAFTKAKGCDFSNSLNWFNGEALYQYYKKHDVINRFKAIHAKLKANGFVNKPPTYENAFVFNDLDDKAMAYEYGNIKAIYHHMQTPVFVIILEETDYQTKMHFRKLADHPKRWYDDDYDFPRMLKALKRIKTVKGLANFFSKHVVTYRWGFAAEMSDTLSQYPSRPCIEDYIKAEFTDKCEGLRYGDCRDDGYIISFEEGSSLLGKSHNIDRVSSLTDAAFLIDIISFLDGGIEELPSEDDSGGNNNLSHKIFPKSQQSKSPDETQEKKPTYSKGLRGPQGLSEPSCRTIWNGSHKRSM